MSDDESAVEARLVAHARDASQERKRFRVPLPEGDALCRVHAISHRGGHWHFVSEGLGRVGIELTYRVPRTDDTPPASAIELLRRLGRDVLHHRQVPAAYDTMTFEPAIEPGSRFSALAFVPDPELEVLGTSDGAIDFLQCVGLTLDEADACRRDGTDVVTSRLALADPLMVTRSDREELAFLPQEGRAISAGMTVPTLRIAAEGSGLRVTIEPKRSQRSVVDQLAQRLASGRSFRLSGPDRALVFEPGPIARIEDEGSTVRVVVDAATVAALPTAADANEVVASACVLVFFDEPGAVPIPLPPELIAASALEVAQEDLSKLSPHEAHRRARAAFDAQRFDEVLALMPRAIADGDHGLLAELLHIDTLRRLGRTDAARALFWQTADAWLGGQRRKVWNTQWKQLGQLARKLKLPDDPRLAKINALAR